MLDEFKHDKLLHLIPKVPVALTLSRQVFKPVTVEIIE